MLDRRINKLRQNLLAQADEAPIIRVASTIIQQAIKEAGWLALFAVFSRLGVL